MTNAAIDMIEHDAIAKAVQHYIDGAKSGSGEDMKPAFHKDATIFGYAGDLTCAGAANRRPLGGGARRRSRRGERSSIFERQKQGNKTRFSVEHVFGNDENGPAAELQARIASIDVVDTVATVRLEFNNWTGSRYTDLFTLFKVDGEWKIMNKVFHLHS